MPRRPVEVRRAGPADAASVCDVLGSVEGDDDPSSPATPAVASRVDDVLARQDVEVYLAVADAAPVGICVVRLGDVLALTGTTAVRIEQLYVKAAWRRRGVAHVLLTTALAAAERSGADEVACLVPGGGRDAHRFLARLGFSRVVTLRATSVGRLRARLASESGQGRRRLAVDALVARRRRQLDRVPTAPFGVRAVPPPVAAPPAPAGPAATARSLRSAR